MTGQRVLLRLDHPWTGHSGVVTEEGAPGDPDGLRVRLDNGIEVFAFPGQWKATATL